MPDTRPGQQTIVWDLDDVLNCFSEAWFRLAWKAEHPECQAVYADLRSNPPLDELGVSRSVYLASIDGFRLSAAARQLPPQPALLRWFRRTGHRFRHVVLTARPLRAVSPAAEWVFTHFGPWVRGFHFVPSPRPRERLPSYDDKKVDVLRQLGGVDYFVDDTRENVVAARALGIRAFLFPQPWNPEAPSVATILAAIESSRGRTRQATKA